MPEISIIVPLYNKKNYVAAMLESVSSQTFSDYELIIIDDGSTDGSGQIAEEYAEQDKRIRVVHIKNGGVSHARNVGLETATGTYITFIDADDTVAPNYLENLYRCITENNVDLVISGVVKVGDDSSQHVSVVPPFHGKKTWEDILPSFALVQKESGIYGMCVAKLFRRSLHKGVFFDEHLKLAEDFDFYIRLFYRIQTVFFFFYALYFYLQNTENSSTRVNDDKIDYLSQAIIQIKAKDFLLSRFMYCGNNKSIIERNISDFFYYSMHYASKERFYDVFQTIYRYVKIDRINMKGKNTRQKVLFWLLKTGRERMAASCVLVWRYARKMFAKGDVYAKVNYPYSSL